MSEVDERRIELAKGLYAAYYDFAGGKSMTTGNPLPTYDEFNSEKIEAWNAVADAAFNYLT